jgi:peroxiredoxin
MPPNIGDPAPQFSAVDVITNQTHNLSDYAGQVVLLIFSGPSWCPPCQFEAPILVDLWDEFESSFAVPKVKFLMISCFGNETPQAFKTAVQNFGITFPALLNPGQDITDLYGVAGVPAMFVVNTEQKICNTHVGASPPADALREDIFNMLIGCGAAEPKSLKIDLSKWAAVMTILFGVTQDGGGLGIKPGGGPIPIDPWGPLVRLTAQKRDILLQLAISELAKGVTDYKTAKGIETMALTAAQASMKKILDMNALLPREMVEISPKPGT